MDLGNRTMSSQTFTGGEMCTGPYEDLCNATIAGDKETVAELLSKGVQVNSTIEEEDSPLHLAIKHDAGCDIIKMLLSSGAQVTCEDEDGELPLMLAIEKRNVEAVKLLLNHGAEVYVMDNEGSTPLHKAAAFGMRDLVELFLSKELFVDVQDGQQYTPLHLAAKGGHESIVKLLLAHGANLHEIDRHGRTALHHSSVGGYFGIVCRLIDYEANVNLKDNNGRTALQDAAWLGHLDAVQILLNCNADMNLADREGFTALHHAAMRGHEDIIFALLDRGADLSIQDKGGRTPLHHVMLRGNYDMMKLLIEFSDDLNTRDAKNETPLSAVLSGMFSTTAFHLEKHPELVELLIKHVVRSKMMKSQEIVGPEEFEGLKAHLSESRWNELCDYCMQCVAEINKIKHFKKSKDESISLYDFLTKHSSILVKYAKNVDSEGILESSEWEIDFPIYSSFLKARARRAVEKKDLLALGAFSLNVIVHQCLPRVEELPDIPACMILEAMNDLDLKNLINACNQHLE
uniref:Uncharacterized protein n=1 Tax=Lygus hesperus TaxID=30085 RepID=A0A0K8S5N6_LYGHE